MSNKKCCSSCTCTEDEESGYQDSAQKTLKIRWQRLVSDEQTCPRCKSTEEKLEKAFFTLKRSLAPLGIKVIIEKDELSVEEFQKDPLKSNQILINNRSLEDWIDGNTGQSPCCDVCGSAECRTIKVGEQAYEAPPTELIINAGLQAASQLVGKETNESCCKSEDPQTSTTDRCLTTKY